MAAGNMETEQKMAIYSGILDGINAAMNRMDAMMTELVTHYENLRKLHDVVTDEILVLTLPTNAEGVQS